MTDQPPTPPRMSGSVEIALENVRVLVRSEAGHLAYLDDELDELILAVRAESAAALEAAERSQAVLKEELAAVQQESLRQFDKADLRADRAEAERDALKQELARRDMLDRTGMNLWRGACRHHWMKEESEPCPVCRAKQLEGDAFEQYQARWAAIAERDALKEELQAAQPEIRDMICPWCGDPLKVLKPSGGGLVAEKNGHVWHPQCADEFESRDELKAAIGRIADDLEECGCDDHSTENCCNQAGVFCAHCIAGAALGASR